MSATPQLSVAQQNALARQAIISQAIKCTTPVASGNFVPSQNPTINIQPRYTGLILGFFIELTATIVNTSAAALTVTPYNAANLLSNVTFTDLNNNQRINTSGWHLYSLDTVKNARPFGSSYTTDSPVKFGSVLNPISAPATIATSATGTVKMVYWVPLAYGAQDLRGALYANVVNATAQLSLTINPTQAIVAAGADPTLAVYSGNAAASITNVAYKVSQVYYSQLPMTNAGAILPLTDLATVYELKATAQTGLSVGQDFPYPYANFRSFLSTMIVYDNGGVLNAGTDINGFKLQAANYSNIFDVNPNIVSLWTRHKIMTDMPQGMYYFDHRDRPLQTVQYGNLELLVNPSSVAANAQLLVGTEAFALVNQVAQAGSLSAG
jgi:hypothetical protein